jgi:NAD(P)-dependent dehydrogenase (short-subunit alcohol dehydrogenase family)
MTEKRVVLVTGSTSGIGMAIAKQLSEDGFTIAFHSKSSVEVGRALAQNYPDSSYTQADLADQRQVRHLIAEVISHHRRLDVLVNNAGINAMIPHNALKEASAEIWRDLYEVNVIAPWTLIAEAESALRESSSSDRPSSILNIRPPAKVSSDRLL